MPTPPGTDYKAAIDALVAQVRKAAFEECIEECIDVVDRYRESTSRFGQREVNRACAEIARDLRAIRDYP